MPAIANRRWVPYPDVTPVAEALAEADGSPKTWSDGAVARVFAAATEGRRKHARAASAESRYLVTDVLLPLIEPPEAVRRMSGARDLPCRLDITTIPGGESNHLFPKEPSLSPSVTH